MQSQSAGVWRVYLCKHVRNVVPGCAPSFTSLGSSFTVCSLHYFPVVRFNSCLFFSSPEALATFYFCLILSSLSSLILLSFIFNHHIFLTFYIFYYTIFCFSDSVYLCYQCFLLLISQYTTLTEALFHLHKIGLNQWLILQLNVWEGDVQRFVCWPTGLYSKIKQLAVIDSTYTYNTIIFIHDQICLCNPCNMSVVLLYTFTFHRSSKNKIFGFIFKYFSLFL